MEIDDLERQAAFLDDFFNDTEGTAKESKIAFHFKGRISFECPVCGGWGNLTFPGHGPMPSKCKSDSKCTKCGGLGRI